MKKDFTGLILGMFIIIIFVLLLMEAIDNVNEQKHALDFCHNKGYEGVQPINTGFLSPIEKYKCYKYDVNGYIEYSGERFFKNE